MMQSTSFISASQYSSLASMSQVARVCYVVVSRPFGLEVFLRFVPFFPSFKIVSCRNV